MRAASTFRSPPRVLRQFLLYLPRVGVRQDLQPRELHWLDVSVGDALRMWCVESVGDLDAQIEHRLDLQRLAIDPVPERLPLQQFHRESSKSVVSTVIAVLRADA